MVGIVRELLVRYKGDTKGLDQASERAKKAVKGVETQTTKSSKASQTAISNLGRSVGILSAAYTALKAVNIADEFALLRGRIENATRSTDEFSVAFSGLKDISRETGSSLNTTVSVFQRLSFVRDEIDASVESMLQFTDTVSQLGIVSGASTGSLNAGLTQLGQSLSSEIVRAEEFNSIMENIPAVGMAIAEEFGVTTGELRQLVINGKVLSEDVFAAILNQSEKTRAEFEKFPMTVGRAFNQLKLDLAESIDGINNATGATGGLVRVIQIAGASLKTMAGLIAGFASSINALFTGITASILKLFDGVVEKLNFVGNLGIKLANKFKDENNQIKLLDPEGLVDDAALVEATLDKMGREFKTAGDSFKSAFDSSGLGGVAESLAGVDTAISVASEKTRVLSQDYSELTIEGNNAKKANDGVTTALENVRRETARSSEELADFFSEGVSGFDNFRDAALRALQDVLKGMLRLQMGGSAGGGIAGSIASGLSGLISGAGVMSQTASLGSRSFGQVAMAAAGGAHGPGFATGGAFTVGGSGGTDSQMVQFKASPNERVTIERPGQNLRGGGSGGVTTVNQSINLTTGVQQTVRAEIQRFLPQFKNIAVEAVDIAQKRNKLRPA